MPGEAYFVRCQRRESGRYPNGSCAIPELDWAPPAAPPLPPITLERPIWFSTSRPIRPITGPRTDRDTARVFLQLTRPAATTILSSPDRLSAWARNAG